MKDLKETYTYEIPKPQKRSASNLADKQKECLDLFLLLPNKKFHEIYLMVNPEASGSKSKIQGEARDLLTSYGAEIYLKERREQMDEFFRETLGTVSPEGVFDLGLDAVPDNAEEILMRKAWKEIESKGLDSKAAEWWFKELLKGKEEDTTVDPPLRILAESCYSCRYKAFCEEQLYDGCKYCKYRKFANKQGVSFTHKNQLELPKDFYKNNKTIKEDGI